MDFLELCQTLREECGISGGDGTPVSVVDQIGEMKRVVNGIHKAYEEVQNLHVDWDFLRDEFSFDTVIGTAEYALSAIDLEDLARWNLGTIRCYTKATGTNDEQDLEFVPWDSFRDIYLRGPVRDTTGRPVKFTIKPDNSFVTWPKCDAVMTITGEFWMVPDVLEANEDEPLFPPRFHRILVAKAKMYYGEFEGAPEVYAAGEKEYLDRLTPLEADQWPGPSIGAGPLA